MSKKEIECDYCHTLISEDDVKCPNCGANCSNAIKKYREEKKIEQQREELTRLNTAKDFFNSYHKSQQIVVTVVGIIIFAVFCIVFYNVYKNFNSDKGLPTIVENDIEDDVEDDIEEHPTIGYKETGEFDNLKVTLDKYEFFEYKSDNFETYNTPKGYQKIAFHFVLENKSDRSKSLYHVIDLTADDYPVERTKMEVTPNFSKVVKGKEKYENLENQTLKSGQTLKGYVGFLVPKDKKTLKFLIDGITIEMKNPAYKK